MILGLAGGYFAGCDGLKHAEPPFTAEFTCGPDDEGCRHRLVITNTHDTPLEIVKVVYNGNYEVPLTDYPYDSPSNHKLPVKLAIGESASFWKWSRFGGGANYTKKVVYIIVDTNKGVFRIEPSGE